jgi:hypothetical protein
LAQTLESEPVLEYFCLETGPTHASDKGFINGQLLDKLQQPFHHQDGFSTNCNNHFTIKTVSRQIATTISPSRRFLDKLQQFHHQDGFSFAPL